MHVSKGEGKPAEKEGANTNSNTKYYQLRTNGKWKWKSRTIRRKEASREGRRQYQFQYQVLPSTTNYVPEESESESHVPKEEGKPAEEEGAHHNAEGDKSFVLLQGRLRRDIEKQDRK